MKPEVGMYARIKEGKIFKINETNVVGKNYYLDIRETREIIKASYNIIDILEVGDYVNGNEIYRINWDSLGLILETTNYSKLREKDIKSIVTKEQFEQMAYKVGE